MLTKGRLLLALPLLLALVGGCGTKKATPAKVSGKVTYKGGPVKGGTVSFHPPEGPPYSTTIAPDGTYRISQIPAGDMKVTVETESLKPAKQQSYGGKTQGSSPTPQGFTVVKGEYTKIPEKYAKKEKTPLTKALSAGSVTYDIELTD